MLATLILFFAIGVLPIFVHEFRNNPRILLTYWFVVALHEVVAFTNTFLIGTIGATGDAQTFHTNALALQQAEDFSFSTGAKLYNNMLAVVYWLFGPSKFLGAQLSILAFAVSCIVLIKMLHLVNLSRYRLPILLAFGALPSMVFFGSVTLRESYQILFFMLSVFFGLKMYMGRSMSVYFVAMILSSLVMGFLHPGLMVYSIFLILVFMVWRPNTTSVLLRINKKHFIIMLVMLVLLAGISYLVREKVVDLDVLTLFSEGKLLDSVLKFRESFALREPSVTARTTYIIATDFSSPFTTVGTFFSIYIHFLFSPFPWQIKNILDVYASMESILRMVLIYYSLRHWQNAYGVQRRILGLLLLLFFTMSFMWSVGTSNYGTGARHNLVAWWILSIAGIPLLMRILSRIRLT